MRFERSDHGYGWWLHLGKRVCWSSRKATTRMWPRVMRGADENCNRSVTVVLWPLGHLDVWWEPTWRTAGRCDDCVAELAAFTRNYAE